MPRCSRPLYVAVPLDSAHPSAAKLWINYLLSREAQDLLYEMDQSDSHWCPARSARRDRPAASGRGALFRADLAFYQRNDEEVMAQTWSELSAC